MKISRSDLNYLAVPAAVAVVVILTGVAALLITQSFVDDAQTSLEGAKAGRAAIQKKVIRATDEERDIRARMGDYQALRDRGVIGVERRLDWVDTVRNVRDERGIFDVRYAIEARRPLEYPGYKPTAGVEFQQSRMKLDLELLHEGDLFNVLADLRAKLAPYVIVRSCELSRSSQGQSNAYPHIHAACVLDLVTIQDRGEVKR